MRTSRRLAWKKLVWRRSVITISLLTIFLSTTTFWWDELFPDLGRPHIAMIVQTIRWWYWVIGGLAAILVLVVEEALREINENEHQVEELIRKAALPNISIVLHAVSIGSNPVRADTMHMLTIVSVRNTGAPSIVENWRLGLDDYPGQEVERITLIEDLVWQYPNMTYTYSATDHIHKKVAENPVPTGGKRVGFTVWRLPGFNPVPLANERPVQLRVTLTAKDVLGNLVTAENKARSKEDIGFYYPGLLGPDEGRMKMHPQTE
jgi:hypothetical protein